MPTRPLAITLNEGTVDLALEAALERLWSESPEVASAYAGVERARCALARARARAGRSSDVDLDASVNYSDETNSTAASVDVGLPQQTYDRNQGNIQKAQAVCLLVALLLLRCALLFPTALINTLQRPRRRPALPGNAMWPTRQFLKQSVPSRPLGLHSRRPGDSCATSPPRTSIDQPFCPRERN